MNHVLQSRQARDEQQILELRGSLKEVLQEETHGLESGNCVSISSSTSWSKEAETVKRDSEDSEDSEEWMKGMKIIKIMQIMQTESVIQKSEMSKHTVRYGEAHPLTE